MERPGADDVDVAKLRTLVGAYYETIRAADAEGSEQSPVRSVLVRALLIRHVDTRLSELKREFHAQVACNASSPIEGALTIVDHGQLGLPDNWLARNLMRVVAVFTLAVVYFVWSATPLGGLLANLTDASLGGNPVKAIQSVEQFDVNSIVALGTALLVLPPVLYCELLLAEAVLSNMDAMLTASDRALVPHSERRDRLSSASLSHLESSVFTSVGITPPRAFPVRTWKRRCAAVGGAIYGLTILAFGVEEEGATSTNALLNYGLGVWVVAVAAAGPTMMRVWRHKPSRTRDRKEYSLDYQAVQRFSAHAIDILMIAVLITVALVAGTSWEDKLRSGERLFDNGSERVPVFDDVSPGDIERGLVEWLLAFHALMLLYAGVAAMQRPPHCGQTVGKTVTHLRVTGSDARPITRRVALRRDVFMKWLVFGLPTLLLIGGPIWAALVVLPNVRFEDLEQAKHLAGAVGTVILLSLPALADGLWTFRSERRTLHDALSETQVESTRRRELHVQRPVAL